MTLYRLKLFGLGLVGLTATAVAAALAVAPDALGDLLPGYPVTLWQASGLVLP